MKELDTIANKIMKSEESNKLHVVVKESFELEEFRPESYSCGKLRTKIKGQ